MPPVNKVSFLIKLSALVVKAVCDLVPDPPADGSVVHVLGPVAREEDSLEDASRELDGVLHEGVECIDNRRPSMGDPVVFIHSLPELAVRCVKREFPNVKAILQECRRTDPKT